MERKEKGIDITAYLLGKKAGGGGEPPVYEEKNVSITQNGDSIITAESGYDAISKVNLSVNVPQPSGKISITQNGTDIDVSSYATADVNVPAGADLSEYFNSTGTGSNYSPYLWQTLAKKIPPFTLSGTTLKNALKGYPDTEIPDISNFSNATNFEGFCQDCVNLINVDLSNKQFSTSINNTSNMFNGCINLEEANLSSLGRTGYNLNGGGMFGGCSKLKKINLSNFAPSSWNSAGAMFAGCTSLEELDISSMTMPSNWFTSMFDNVPDNCLIYVKDQTAKNWFTTNYSNLTNVQIKGA